MRARCQRFILLSSLLWVQAAWAQQTIFNVPTADITPKGEAFLEHESQFRTWQPGPFVTNTEYFAEGIGHEVELDATLFNVNAPATNNIALGLGLKKNIALFPQKLPSAELRLTLGQIVPVSLQGQGVGNWSYSLLSARVPKLKTRLAGGVSTGTRQIFGRTTVHFIGSVEQPLTKRFQLQADWFSGTHALGFLIAGFSYQLPRDTALFAGYQIPNNKRCGRSGFVVEFAKYMR